MSSIIVENDTSTAREASSSNNNRYQPLVWPGWDSQFTPPQDDGAALTLPDFSDDDEPVSKNITKWETYTRPKRDFGAPPPSLKTVYNAKLMFRQQQAKALLESTVNTPAVAEPIAPKIEFPDLVPRPQTPVENFKTKIVGLFKRIGNFLFDKSPLIGVYPPVSFSSTPMTSVKKLTYQAKAMRGNIVFAGTVLGVVFFCTVPFLMLNVIIIPVVFTFCWALWVLTATYIADRLRPLLPERYR